MCNHNHNYKDMLLIIGNKGLRINCCSLCGHINEYYEDTKQTKSGLRHLTIRELLIKYPNLKVIGISDLNDLPKFLSESISINYKASRNKQRASSKYKHYYDDKVNKEMSSYHEPKAPIQSTSSSDLKNLFRASISSGVSGCIR